MHRAVAARMQNPELSLFEALKMGGFDYPADEDASIMDTEKVTLGQRKNQLSRRLRLARKQQEESGDDESKSSKHGHAKFSHAHNQQANNAAMSSEAQRQLEKLMQRSKMTGGVKRNVAAAELGPDAEMLPTNEDEAGMLDDQNARRIAKFHPQYQPLFIPRAASAARNSFGPNAQSQLQQQLVSRTPQLSPLASPLGLGGHQGGSSGLPSNPLGPSNQAASASLFPSSGLLGQQAAPQRRQGNHPSGVAIASLSATAQSIGLSLEQLAVALSSSSNLVKVLSNNSGNEQQQELALRLYRNESRALYQRCMLLAGFRPEDAEESSTAHLQFAFSAWQMEGKRLQELMGEENKNSINNLAGLNNSNNNANANSNNNSNTGQLKMPPDQLQEQQRQHQQQMQEQASHHSHSHQNGGNSDDHDHCHAHQHHEGQHVHQVCTTTYNVLLFPKCLYTLLLMT